MANRTLHRLTEAAVKAARPIEKAASPEDAAVDAVVSIDRDKVRARLRGDRRAALRSVARLGGVAQRMESGKPFIKRRTRWLCDGGGLWLSCVPSPHDPDGCSKSWVFRYSLPEKVTSKNGKVRQRQRQHGLGSANTLTLEEAREAARECRKMLLSGTDPINAKRGAAAAQAVAELKLKTFDVVRDEYLMHRGERGEKDAWSAVHTRNWIQSMRDWISPVLGSVPISAVDTQLAIRALSEVWSKHPVTATRVRGRCEDVYSYAVLHGYAQDPNPFRWRGHLQHHPGFSQKHSPEHLDALHYSKMPEFWSRLTKVETTASDAVRWCILTACRTIELRRAKVGNIDLENRCWTIPKGNIKNKQEHVVPLTDAALEILGDIGGRDLSAPLFDIRASEMLSCVKELEPNTTVHGTSRATFKTWSAECTATSTEVIEACMSHITGSAVERAYHRGSPFLEKRRRHLEAWSAFVTGQDAASDNVVRMVRG